MRLHDAHNQSVRSSSPPFSARFYVHILLILLPLLCVSHGTISVFHAFVTQYVTQNVTQRKGLLTVMRYLLQRQGWYLYNRRVPLFFREFDPRERVRIALGTKCIKTAMKKATVINDEIEHYWQTLFDAGQTHSEHHYQATVQLAKQLGFRYMPAVKLAQGEMLQLLNRLFKIAPVQDNEIFVSAALGGHQKTTRPTLSLSQSLKKFWHYSTPSLLNKTDSQQRKWKNPRKKAVKNFIAAVGDKEITAITSQDLITFRDAWLKRMEKDDIKADTVNKDFTHLRGILDTVATHEGLDIDTQRLFRKIHIKETKPRTRTAYTTAFIQDKILNHENLANLDNETRSLLHVCIQTGARPIELVHLRTEDIILDHTIPHIHIRPYKGYSLKTPASMRKIPLIGTALQAFKAFPEGFKHYQGRSDALSTALNTYLTQHNLRPTKTHSLYSFRHSFQDRLNALELPDRIQCQLMGHTYPRPKYGTGATLEHLQKIMKKMVVV